MKKTAATAACALAFGLGGAALAEPVKVGMITTLSGDGAGIGVEVRDGFMLALKLAEGNEVEVLVEDDGRRPDLAVQIADRMIQSEDVDILTGILWSNLAMAVVPGAVAQGTFYLSPNAGPSALAGRQCNENYFNVAFQTDMLAEAAGAYATEEGYEKVFLLAPKYPAGVDTMNGFKSFYKGELAGELYTKLGQTDYAVEIAQIKASGADAVFFFLPGGMGIAFVKQYAQSEVGIELLGPGWSFSQEILPAMGDAALGAKNTSQWSPDLDNAANMRFVAAFQAEYGRLPSAFASQGYDTANLILSATESASVEDPAAFRAALKAADFASVRGDFRFGNNNHPIQDMYLREVVKEGGQFTNKVIRVVLEDHQDAYAAECPMQ
ncbi:ABC transporter substrate-binding protein [Amaricoccus sp.]|uniref:ABC transporter substrate-binding protein n=1 Tax=Amaricoccus sp. TaxID=1872485 RepID=UPI00261A8BD4|nr:ABC transporter substrate-binding protein [Amaricoccus sp.]HRO12720.1 ABC transporter substrate-binding protein [Amaricoccus sp.]